MGLKIFLNGEFVEKENAKISVFDHGLLYGDGVFEGIRSYGGRPFKLKEHVERLYKSAKVIMLEIPYRQEEMAGIIEKTLNENEIKDGYVRVVVTRGEGDLGLDPLKCPKPSVFVIADSITLYPKELYRKGIEVITVHVKRVSPSMFDPRVKSLNYLNNIMAKIQANNAGKPEALMLDSDGYVIECSGENVFAVRKGAILTPPAYLGSLEGITRQTVIELAVEMGISVSEERITLYDIYTADECFLTGSAAEIVPVSSVDGRMISTGEAGEITKKLISAFRIFVEKSD
jgi:branched-chain amino acid aminotransferase